MVLLAGCVNLKPATLPQSGVLFSVTFSGDSDPKSEPAGLIVDVEAKQGSTSRAFAFTPNSRIPGRYTTFLVRLDLPAGRYRVTRLSATTAFDMPIPQYDIAPTMVFDVRPNATDYAGHIELSNPRAGGSVGDAPRMVISDAYEEELPNFVHAWPALHPRAIGRRAPPTTTAIPLQVLARAGQQKEVVSPRAVTGGPQGAPHSPPAASSPSVSPTPNVPPSPSVPSQADAVRAQQRAPAEPIARQPSVATPGAGNRNEDGQAVITILEGHALFIRGVVRFRAAPGVRLVNGDVITTEANTLLQLEYEGGTRVEMGPKTQFMLLEPEAGARPRRAAYLLSGWIKVIGEPRPEALAIIRTARVDLTATDSIAVARAARDELDVFAETGSTRLIARTAGASAAQWVLRQGQFFEQRAQRAGAVSPRPRLEFLANLPTAYHDSLPSRINAFRGSKTLAQRAPDFTFADVEQWLKLNEPIGRELAERWKAKASDPAFRKALEAEIQELPEWDPILHPARYPMLGQHRSDTGTR